MADDPTQSTPPGDRTADSASESGAPAQSTESSGEGATENSGAESFALPGSSHDDGPVGGGSSGAGHGAAADPSKGASAKLKIAAFKQKFGIFAELFRSLRSQDRSTRKMALFFWVCSLVAVVSAVQVIRTLGKDRAPPPKEPTSLEIEAQKWNEYLAQQAEEAKQKKPYFTVQGYSLKLKSAPGTRPSGRALGIAEMDLVLECDTEATCSYVKDRLPQLMDRLSAGAEPMEKEEILSSDGKARLKQRLLDSLNQWLPQGKIRKIFISRFLVS